MTGFARWRLIAKGIVLKGFLTKSLLVFWLVGSLPSLAQSVTGSVTGSAEESAEDLADQHSQVIPDRNLDTDLQTQVLESANGRTIEITGGETRGSNLFHSFETFNIGSNQAATFQQSSSIENILSRVVGAQPSNIFGTLGVSGEASLWLINPNGIVFGENARLNISGDFYATTGSAVTLGESVFSATDSEQSQLLAVMPETALMQHLTVDSGDITINSLSFGRNANSGLDGALTLAGREVVVESAIRRNGDLSIAAFDSITANSRLSTAGSVGGGNVSLMAGGDVTTSVINTSSSAESGDAGNGGSIGITTTRGGDIVNRGRLNSRSFGGRSRRDESAQSDSDAGMGGSITLVTQSGGDIVNLDSLDSQSNASVGNSEQGGEIVIQAMGEGDILNEGTLRSQSITITGDAGSGGAVTIAALAGNITNSGVPGNFVNRNNQTGRNSIAAQSAAQTGDTQNGGRVSITASGDIENTGSISTYSLTNNGRSGEGGEILVRSTGGGSITNRDTLSALSGSNEGPAGSGGNITLETNGEGSIITSRDITAQSIANGSGDTSNASAGGNISIQTERGDIINRPLAGDRSGNGGSLNSRSVARRGNTGDGGSIAVRSSQGGDIVLNAYIDAKSYSLGSGSSSGGDVLIRTSGDVVGDTATNIVTSAVSNSSVGDDSSNNSDNRSNNTNQIRGGNVTISAGRVENFNIFTLANRGNSGNVEISSEGDLAIENLQIITNEDVIGGSFDFDSNPLFPATLAPDDDREDPNVPIRITTPQSGLPGDVSIAAERDLVATNLQVLSDAKASTEPIDNTMTPNAGDIILSSRRSIQLFDSRLETSTSSRGDGGDIRLADSRSVVLDNSALLTNTEGEAQAGNISIDGFDYLLMRNGSLLQADARGQEEGGSIEISSERVVASPDGNNDMLATATAGSGGNILFSQEATLFGFESSRTSSTRRLRSRRSNDISARSEFGEDGSITFDAIINDPLRVEPESLDEEFSTPDQLISNSCIAQDELAGGSFVIPGSGDLPTTPSDASSSLYDLGDVQPLVSGLDGSFLEDDSEQGDGLQKAWELGDPIVESSAIARLADGRIVFGQPCGNS